MYSVYKVDYRGAAAPKNTHALTYIKYNNEINQQRFIFHYQTYDFAFSFYKNHL